MATPVLEKFGTTTPITISLGGLANGSARQGTMIDNTTSRYGKALVSASIKLGTTPAANTLISLYILRDDMATTPIITDGGGAVDAAITLKNAQSFGTLNTGASPATGDVLSDVFIVYDPGAMWTVAASNGTTVALDPTNGNHVINYYGVTSEIQ